MFGSTNGAIKGAQRLRYFLLNKPRGYVTTRSDPERRPTVLDLLRGVREYVYPVGRLDFDSEGLLILTNDGDLAAALMHPSHEVERVYDALVLGVPDAHDIERLSKGVVHRRASHEPGAHRTGGRAAACEAVGVWQRHLTAARHHSRRADQAGPQDVRCHRASGAHAQAHPHRSDCGRASPAGHLP